MKSQADIHSLPPGPVRGPFVAQGAHASFEAAAQEAA